MLQRLRVDPGSSARIAARDPDDKLGRDKGEAEERLERLVDRIDELQYRLHAEGRHSVLLVLQGLDASGKDGVIRRVFDGVNPTAVNVTSFKVPAGPEVRHDYLWRIHAALPARGELGVFNPVALRGRRRRAHAWARPGGRVASPLRAHPRVRADARRRRDRRDQGVPQRLARGAARALPGADRRPGEALEVPSRRPERARTLRRLGRRVGGGADGDVDGVGAVARRSGRPQLGEGARRAELVVATLERLDPQLPAPEAGLEGLQIV